MKRKKLSKERQEVHRQLALWLQKVKEIEYKIVADPGANDQETLRYCKAEVLKLQKVARSLDRSVYKQRSWASGKIG
jgi:hypothetical protein